MNLGGGRLPPRALPQLLFQGQGQGQDQGWLRRQGLGGGRVQLKGPWQSLGLVLGLDLGGRGVAWTLLWGLSRWTWALWDMDLCSWGAMQCEGDMTQTNRTVSLS